MKENVKCGQVSGLVRNRARWLFLFWRGAPVQWVRCQIKSVKKGVEHSDLYTMIYGKCEPLLIKILKIQTDPGEIKQLSKYFPLFI